MFRKIIIALFATLALSATFDVSTKAQASNCEAGSAYPIPRC